MKKESEKNIAFPEPNMSCPICCEDYNQSQRKEIKCGYCDFDVCRKCCETYLLSEAAPRCMKPECGKEWSRQFLVANFTPAFVKKRYKEHRENILLQREMSLMPETQERMEKEKHQSEIRKEIKILNDWIRNLEHDKIVSHDLCKLEKYTEPNTFEKNNGIEKWMLFRFKEINKQIATLSEIIHKLRLELESGYIQERRKFLHACPDNECRGFLSNRWKCGMCNKYTCSECHELKAEPHVCNPEVIESVKLLQKDSKPCPKCASQIYRIAGCDHMWCTNCHTGFNWKTGKIESRPENPHYYEWVRQGGGIIPRQPGDNPCGENVGDYIVFQDDLYVNGKVSLSMKRRMNKILYYHQENYHTRMHAFAYDEHNQMMENEVHRINYLKKSIDEKKLKHYIQINEKKHQKKREIRNVLELSCSMIRDIALRAKTCLMSTPPNQPPNQFSNYLIEMDNAIAYCNELFQNISMTYGCVRYEFDSDFRMYSTGSTAAYKRHKEEEEKKAAAAAEEKKAAVIDLCTADK